jgi:hypothetical protein
LNKYAHSQVWGSCVKILFKDKRIFCKQIIKD